MIEEFNKMKEAEYKAIEAQRNDNMKEVEAERRNLEQERLSIEALSLKVREGEKNNLLWKEHETKAILKAKEDLKNDAKAVDTRKSALEERESAMEAKVASMKQTESELTKRKRSCAAKPRSFASLRATFFQMRKSCRARICSGCGAEPTTDKPVKISRNKEAARCHGCKAKTERRRLRIEHPKT